jgi:hypothetical protein
MKHLRIAALLISLMFAIFFETSTAHATSPEAYPGSFWGTGTNDFNDIEGMGTQGVLSQGVQWFTLPGDIKFQTYASYSWRFRAKNNDYYDAHGPALGAEFSWKFLNLGWDYEWQKYPSPSPGTDIQNSVVYITWYKRFDLFSPTDGSPSFLGIPVLGFPTTTWGKIFRDSKPVEGNGTLGWISQGIEWCRFSNDITFKTLAIYRWRARSENSRYYDFSAPGIGIEFSRNSVDLGLEYSWANYPRLETNANNLHAYLTWYFDWNLKGD